jgi:glycosyltransferase involved in cell wall biosynthesis
MNSRLFKSQSLVPLTIVIPVLNEIQYLPKVISQLVTFDWIGEGFVPQIVVVDGGSIDGSLEYLRSVAGITIVEVTSRKGRGAALRRGLELSKGEIAVTFPADSEYRVEAIIDVARALGDREYGIVFGSRSTLCIDTDSRLREIYGGRTREYFLSKWGGLLLSSLSAIKFHRWIADPLTSVKGFKGLSRMHLTFQGDSLDWDTQIIIDSWRNKIPIIEVPVEFYPRTRRQGKKTTVNSGLISLKQLLKSSSKQ